MMKHNNPKLLPLLTICVCFVSGVFAKCPYGGTTISIRVETEFFERSVAKMSTHSKSVRSSKNFKREYDKLATSASIRGRYVGFSAAVSASYEGVTDSASSGEDYKELITKDTIEFHPNENQIIRRITTTISINEAIATEQDELIAYAQPKDQDLSPDDLRKMANEYMKHKYGNNVTNNVYQETTTTCKPSNYSLV